MLNAYFDESGIITNNYTKNHRYFIIAIVMTNDRKRIRKRFKDSRLRSIKGKSNLVKKLKEAREIKGIDISEARKAEIYISLLSFQKQNNEVLEVGIIIVDNKDVKCFFKWRQSGISSSISKNELSLMIDERNVATGSRFTLQDYLNTELRLKNGVEFLKMKSRLVIATLKMKT